MEINGKTIYHVDLLRLPALWETIANEIERLQAIVAKLPVTADGVPVMPEMTVWYLWPDTAPACEAVKKHQVMAVYADGASLRGVYHAPAGSYGDTPIPWSKLFSTYEAGKAVEQKARGE